MNILRSIAATVLALTSLVRRVLPRLVAYGIAGWCMEIVFTALCGLFGDHDRSLRGETYLWMFPIYAMAGVTLEALERRLARLSRPLRASIHVVVIYAIEYSCGAFLRHTLGVCPWDYQDRGVNVDGLIRLDFLPCWYGCALAFEPVRAAVERALASARDAEPHQALALA
jgi:uncharacterized membrane protein